MPISNPIHPFTEQAIEQFAPRQTGVYALYEGTQLTYYGRAVESTIRDRLMSHKRGYEGRCTQVATHFNTEVTSRPVSREKELLEEYRRAHGRLPRCNERVG